MIYIYLQVITSLSYARYANIHTISISNQYVINISSTSPMYAYRGTSATRVIIIIIIIILLNDLNTLPKVTRCVFYFS